MKYIILLASRDDKARSNYKRLADHRQYSLENELPSFTYLEYDPINKILSPNPNKKFVIDGLIGKDNPHKKNTEIEFIAHGNPNLSETLLIEVEKKKQVKKQT